MTAFVVPVFSMQNRGQFTFSISPPAPRSLRPKDSRDQSPSSPSKCSTTLRRRSRSDPVPDQRGLLHALTHAKPSPLHSPTPPFPISVCATTTSRCPNEKQSKGK
ncbi:hypothetical protein SETIT_2G215000v2 [Setaria italica]|uniref:Uncharacterized protein n=1 Tax=Setaria italica TaxID=4555 RepID=A0A368Q1Y0_SETIT|nr:uncharacterized protein LOC101752765 [Setaria italica]XP_034580893.1 uncharacterized protein LOC117844252 [Setaria viridis]RCV11794.1 hypothetical protein SETIT_2G215000v2 [Setaria italica]